MPTYEYKCLACEEKFDEFQRMTEAPLTTCKFCGGQVERLISAGSGFLFKGSGFYITDNRSEKYKSAASNDKPVETKSGSPSTDKKPASDKKPADSPPQSGVKPAS